MFFFWKVEPIFTCPSSDFIGRCSLDGVERSIANDLRILRALHYVRHDVRRHLSAMFKNRTSKLSQIFFSKITCSVLKYKKKKKTAAIISEINICASHLYAVPIAEVSFVEALQDSRRAECEGTKMSSEN